MTQPSTDTNVAVVERFLYALRDKDYDEFAALADDNLVYENVGYSRLRGGRRITRLFQRTDRPGSAFDVRFHRNVAEGGTVINERTDLVGYGPVRIVVRVCGVFEVHDGRVTLWRDYFDMVYLAGAIVRGLLGAVIPTLRPSL